MLEKNNFYLVGIKGVAMTALAACLVDAGKQVRGSDVIEDFPTKESLAKLNLILDFSFDAPLPADTQVVIFSGANGGSHNPQILAAKKRGLLVLTHAQALAAFFNSKRGLAVCGVGGKSSISAMLAFGTQKLKPQSYAVGVGEILGLKQIGQFLPQAPFFIAEADEYVEDPIAAQTAIKKGAPITPRFSRLIPEIIICSSLRFDHPDVYRDFVHTKQVYGDFFRSLKSGGTLIYNGDDVELVNLVKIIQGENHPFHFISYGEGEKCDFRLTSYQIAQGKAHVTVRYQKKDFCFTFYLPGKFNALNALAALAAASVMGLPLDLFVQALADYRSVKRRFEFMGERHGVLCYDDYAHHPAEIAASIAAMRAWYPDKRLVVAFQSHTYSRTKQLFPAFIDAFSLAPEVVMIDIFPSAREAFDPSITSDMLCQAIEQKFPGHRAVNLRTLTALQDYLAQEKAGTVFLTLGAGDIYQVYH